MHIDYLDSSGKYGHISDGVRQTIDQSVEKNVTHPILKPRDPRYATIGQETARLVQSSLEEGKIEYDPTKSEFKLRNVPGEYWHRGYEYETYTECVGRYRVTTRVPFVAQTSFTKGTFDFGPKVLQLYEPKIIYLGGPSDLEAKYGYWWDIPALDLLSDQLAKIIPKKVRVNLPGTFEISLAEEIITRPINLGCIHRTPNELSKIQTEAEKNPVIYAMKWFRREDGFTPADLNKAISQLGVPKPPTNHQIVKELNTLVGRGILFKGVEKYYSAL